MGMLQARRGKDGSMVWSQFLNSNVSSAPSVGQLSDDSALAVLVASHNELETFDAESGERLEWKWSPPATARAKGDEAPNHLCKSDAFSNIAISGDGTAYVGHTSGQLFALKDKNGD